MASEKPYQTIPAAVRLVEGAQEGNPYEALVSFKSILSRKFTMKKLDAAQGTAVLESLISALLAVVKEHQPTKVEKIAGPIVGDIIQNIFLETIVDTFKLNPDENAPLEFALSLYRAASPPAEQLKADDSVLDPQTRLNLIDSIYRWVKKRTRVAPPADDPKGCLLLSRLHLDLARALALTGQHVAGYRFCLHAISLPTGDDISEHVAALSAIVVGWSTATTTGDDDGEGDKGKRQADGWICLRALFHLLVQAQTSIPSFGEQELRQYLVTHGKFFLSNVAESDSLPSAKGPLECARTFMTILEESLRSFYVDDDTNWRALSAAMDEFLSLAEQAAPKASEAASSNATKVADPMGMMWDDARLVVSRLRLTVKWEKFSAEQKAKSKQSGGGGGGLLSMLMGGDN